MTGGFYACETHPKGHRTPEARDECLAKAERKAERARKKAKEEKRKANNRLKEPEEQYIRRRYCIEQTPAVNVAAGLNRDYPRGDRPWTWVEVVKSHAAHLRWPRPGEFNSYLQDHPDILLPSEVRKLAGEVGVEDAQ